MGRNSETLYPPQAGRLDRKAVAAADQIQTAAVRHAEAPRQNGPLIRRRGAERRYKRDGKMRTRFEAWNHLERNACLLDIRFRRPVFAISFTEAFPQVLKI